MPQWLIFATLSLVCWAAWSLLSPLAGRGLPGSMVQFLSIGGLAPVVLLLLFSRRLWLATNLRLGICLATLTGFLAGLGNIMVYKALESGGPVSIVFPLSSLAPAVPVLLAPLLFHERIGLWQWGAVGVALVAIVLVNMTPQLPGDGGTSATDLMSPWMIYAVLSLVIFGITYLPQKAATYFISDELSTVAFAGGFVVLDGVLLATDRSLTWNVPVLAGAVSVAIGVIMGLGSLALFMAYRHGKATIVTPYVQLFPVISVLAGIPLYQERLDWWRGSGVALAIAAGLALSLEREPEPGPPISQANNAAAPGLSAID